MDSDQLAVCPYMDTASRFLVRMNFKRQKKIYQVQLEGRDLHLKSARQQDSERGHIWDFYNTKEAPQELLEAAAMIMMILALWTRKMFSLFLLCQTDASIMKWVPLIYISPTPTGWGKFDCKQHVSSFSMNTTSALGNPTNALLESPSQ